MTKMTEQELAEAIGTISKAHEGDRITFTTKDIDIWDGGTFVIKQQLVAFYDGEGSWSGCSIKETRTTYSTGKVEKRRDCPNFRQSVFAIKSQLESVSEVYDFIFTTADDVDKEF